MPDTPDSVAADWLIFREWTTSGRSVEAVEYARRVIAESTDQRRVVQAMIEKFVALINIGEINRLGSISDEIYAVLRTTRDPRLDGEFHAICGALAFEAGSTNRAMMNLGRAERSLRRMTEVNLAAVDAWHDLSVAYSACGFHARAMESQREAAALCARAGLSPAYAVLVEAQVRAAIGLDREGDTEGCVAHLRTIVADGGPLVTELEVAERIFLRYAVGRLAALGHASPLTVPAEHASDLFLAGVNHLTAVCAALAAPDAVLALKLLDEAPHAIDVFGIAEPLRLRSLALTQLGETAAALAIERETLRVIMSEDRELRELLTDSISARLDQERLRRVAMQYAGEAYTDPLTGLPNRRRTAAVAGGLAKDNVDAMLGILDLDGFKAVNDTHGHPAGDLVLQRVAGIFARTVRTGDLLARHGGDEFVMILPGTNAVEAQEIGDRIRAAVREEDWSALVPHTPVSVSVGWAVFAGDLDAALKDADEALYRTKRGGMS